MTGRFPVIAIRGGEPSLHPRLADLIGTAARFADAVYIETHGRWLNKISFRPSLQNITDICRSTGATLKISFDAMHGLSGVKLAELTAVADAAGAAWVIAITEDSPAAALKLLAAVPWIHEDRVIFQPKAKRAADLVRAKVATITSSGAITDQLTHKFEKLATPAEVPA